MALRITPRETEGVTVLVLEGRIVLGAESSSLRDNVKGLLAEGRNGLVLNMNNVTLVDSAGLDTLVAAHSRAKSAGASLRLCNLGPRIIELLQITKLNTIFEVSKTEADAVRAMAKKTSND
jgi:anti-sigma B factor antagonist